MSPGVTFERVYHELKRMLAEGELPPGAPIEPALIGKQIASSITPIRDALHRLTGERLVEAPNHNGFRAPLPTEAALRDLYRWNGLLLGLAAKQLSPGAGSEAIGHSITAMNVAASAAAVFLDVARRAGNLELHVAIGSLNDRLALFRRVETAVLDEVPQELSRLARVSAIGDRTALGHALARYHRRRIAVVAGILSYAMHTAER